MKELSQQLEEEFDCPPEHAAAWKSLIQTVLANGDGALEDCKPKKPGKAKKELSDGAKCAAVVGEAMSKVSKTMKDGTNWRKLAEECSACSGMIPLLDKTMKALDERMIALTGISSEKVNGEIIETARANAESCAGESTKEVKEPVQWIRTINGFGFRRAKFAYFRGLPDGDI